MAYLNYEVCDAYNTCETGVIQIYVVDSATQPQEDTIHISTAEESDINIALDVMDYSIIDSSEKGDLLAYPYGILYQPYNNTIGKYVVTHKLYFLSYIRPLLKEELPSETLPAIKFH